MTDLLTHVLAAYVLAKILAHKELIRRRHVPVAMVGAAIPDAGKVYFLLGQPTFEVLGIPLSWHALQTLGGVGLLGTAGVLLFARTERQTAAGLVGLGAGVHFCLDLLLARAHGLSPPYFYPLTWWQPPSVDLYLSSDIWPSLLAVGLAGLVWSLCDDDSIRSE